jgi:hypothetical protein
MKLENVVVQNYLEQMGDFGKSQWLITGGAKRQQ